MTQSDSSEQELLPEPEERVRRLLAEARHDGGLPADVAARLDRVLAELAAGGSRGPRSPAELAARRRRRVRGMLVAAAAAAAVGIGLGQVVPGVGGDASHVVTADSVGGSVADSAGSAAGSAGRLQDPAGAQAADEGSAPAASTASGEAAEDDVRADGEAAPEPLLTESFQELAPGTVGDRRGLVLAHGRPVRVRAERFAADAVRARDRLDSGRRGTKGGRGFACEQASWGPGTAVGVLYGGRPHVLVFREPAGDTQVVDLLQCGTGETLRSTTLRAG